MFNIFRIGLRVSSTLLLIKKKKNRAFRITSSPVWLIGQNYTWVMIWASSTKGKSNCKNVSTLKLKLILLKVRESAKLGENVYLEDECMHAYIVEHMPNRFGGILFVSEVSHKYLEKSHLSYTW
jgi:hypothetical protein